MQAEVAKVNPDADKSPEELIEGPFVWKILNRLVDRWAYRIHESIASRDEIESAAMFGLWDAALRYQGDNEAGAKFTSYLRRRVEGAIIDELRSIGAWGIRGNGRRKSGKSIRPKSLASTIHRPGPSYRHSGEEGPELSTVIPSDDWPIGWELEFQDEMRVLARRSGGDRERDVIERLYLRPDATMKRVGEEIGLSESRVSQIHTRAIEALEYEIQRMNA